MLIKYSYYHFRKMSLYIKVRYFIFNAEAVEVNQGADVHAVGRGGATRDGDKRLEERRRVALTTIALAAPAMTWLPLNVAIVDNDRGASPSSYRARALGAGAQEVSRGTA